MIELTRKEALLNSLNKLEAYRVIQNEMGRTIAAFNFRQADRVLSHFALDKEDVWLEFADEGVFEGSDNVKAIVNEMVGAKPLPGEMLDIQLTTPIIEVADDLQSAKALWWSPGAGAIPTENADPQAIWAWGMLAVDFVNENGSWLILHLHYFRYIKCSYEKGWVEDTSMINRLNVPVHPLAKPSTYHNPYSPKCIRDGVPASPRPYKTYDGPGWMLSRDKTR